MMLAHEPRRHIQQYPVGVDKANLLAVANKSYRLALDNRHPNLIGKKSHNRRLLHPWNLFQLLATIG